MTLAYVGMGANVGDPRTHLDTAWQALHRMPQTKAIARSSVYRSAPVGYDDQPDFLNCVAKLDTALPALALLAELQEIERHLGRTRSFPNAPRTLDLDLLLYGAQMLDDPALTLPHPRMHERAFVLAPLVELEPAIEIPRRGPAAELLRACSEQRVQRIAA